MQNDKNTLLERLIAKIDNDFNPDNSDWIPRVGAWAIDAMGMIDCLPKKKVRTKYTVQDRIVNVGCGLGDNFKVYDKCGNIIPELNIEDKANERCSFSTGEGEFTVNNVPETIAVQAVTINGYPPRYNVVDIKRDCVVKNYVKVSCNQLELSFDTSFVYIEHEVIETYCSNHYGCELPKIPNNARLLEAIANYCMYKMLCRGYKHPVFNLQASQYGTNPYYTWMQLKEEAKRSIINDGVDNADLDGIWRSAFYISAFDPKRK